MELNLLGMSSGCFFGNNMFSEFYKNLSAANFDLGSLSFFKVFYLGFAEQHRLTFAEPEHSYRIFASKETTELLIELELVDPLDLVSVFLALISTSSLLFALMALTSA